MSRIDPDTAWQLHPQVSVRPEPFGALLYHFGTRKLSFLKDRTLLTVVEGLADAASARAACDAAGIAPEPGSTRKTWNAKCDSVAALGTIRGNPSKRQFPSASQSRISVRRIPSTHGTARSSGIFFGSGELWKYVAKNPGSVPCHNRRH